MWKRKKHDDPQAQVTAADQSAGQFYLGAATHPEGAALPTPHMVVAGPAPAPLPGSVETGEFGIPIDQLPPDVLAALQAHTGGATMSHTTVTSGGHTSESSALTRDGQPLDSNSPEGRALMEALTKLAEQNNPS